MLVTFSKMGTKWQQAFRTVVKAFVAREKEPQLIKASSAFRQIRPAPACPGCVVNTCVLGEPEGSLSSVLSGALRPQFEEGEREGEEGERYVLPASSQSRPFLLPHHLPNAHPLMSLLDSKSSRLPCGPQDTLRPPHSAPQPPSCWALFPFSESPILCCSGSVHSILGRVALAGSPPPAG